jgi:hypothetical protein
VEKRPGAVDRFVVERNCVMIFAHAVGGAASARAQLMEATMRRAAIVLAVTTALSSMVFGTAHAQQSFTPITPQTSNVTSTVTNCMMSCNSTAASCQTTCVVPGASGASIAAQTAASTAGTGVGIGTSCQLACTTTQLTCQGVCAQLSPSR